MSHEINFRDVLRREVDAIPLPPEEKWVPRTARQRGANVLFFTGGLVATFILVAALASAFSQLALFEEHRALATPRVSRPTVIDGRRVVPLPNIHRNMQYSYNLVVQAWFRQSTLPVGAESNAGLLYREVFSARSEALTVPITASRFSPWDLIVEVWRRDGRSAEEWAPTFCAPQAYVGSAPCALSTAQLRGTRAVLATIGPPVRGKVYMVERGDQMLVLRFAVGDETARPPDVTEEILDQIVHSLGLP